MLVVRKRVSVRKRNGKSHVGRDLPRKPIANLEGIMGTKNRESLVADHGRANAKSGGEPKAIRPEAVGRPSLRESAPKRY